jgi:hypothetical protein
LGKTVRQLLSQIDSYELTEWFAYYSIEPFGEERADLRAATMACTVANAAGGRGKNKPPFTVKDFLLDFEPKEPQTMEELKNIFRNMAR